MGHLRIKKPKDSFTQMIEGATFTDSAPLCQHRINNGEWIISVYRRVCIQWRDNRQVWYSGEDPRSLSLFHKETNLEVGWDHRYLPKEEDAHRT